MSPNVPKRMVEFHQIFRAYSLCVSVRGSVRPSLATFRQVFFYFRLCGWHYGFHTMDVDQWRRAATAATHSGSNVDASSDGTGPHPSVNCQGLMMNPSRRACWGGVVHAPLLAGVCEMQSTSVRCEL